MRQEQKALIALILFGLFAIGFFLKIFISLNFGEFGLVSDRASDFLKLIHQGKYTEAYHYVDDSKITLDELKKVTALASHYYLGAYYFTQKSKSLYIAGFKPDTTDNDEKNNEALEFWIGKIQGKWKVIHVSKIPDF